MLTAYWINQKKKVFYFFSFSFGLSFYKQMTKVKAEEEEKVIVVERKNSETNFVQLDKLGFIFLSIKPFLLPPFFFFLISGTEFSCTLW